MADGSRVVPSAIPESPSRVTVARLCARMGNPLRNRRSDSSGDLGDRRHGVAGSRQPVALRPSTTGGIEKETKSNEVFMPDAGQLVLYSVRKSAKV